MSEDGKSDGKWDHNDQFNPKNIKHPTSVEELPDDLRKKIEAKFSADPQGFLESCTKDQRDKVTQYREPIRWSSGFFIHCTGGNG